jgi:hypothetical protein
MYNGALVVFFYGGANDAISIAIMYNGLKGQIMTFQESRKTNIIKKLDITFLIFK